MWAKGCFFHLSIYSQTSNNYLFDSYAWSLLKAWLGRIQVENNIIFPQYCPLQTIFIIFFSNTEIKLRYYQYFYLILRIYVCGCWGRKKSKITPWFLGHVNWTNEVRVTVYVREKWMKLYPLNWRCTVGKWIRLYWIKRREIFECDKLLLVFDGIWNYNPKCNHLGKWA